MTKYRLHSYGILSNEEYGTHLLQPSKIVPYTPGKVATFLGQSNAKNAQPFSRFLL
jgi:hypothetical protein